MSLQSGFIAEDRALRYLCEQGLVWVESNYRCRTGEIDLIMRDKDYFVFVEVRSRTHRAYGGATQSVTQSKKQKLIRTAMFYLQSKKLYDKHPCRFDVLSMDGTQHEITWIKNAFGTNF